MLFGELDGGIGLDLGGLLAVLGLDRDDGDELAPFLETCPLGLGKGTDAGRNGGPCLR